MIERICLDTTRTYLKAEIGVKTWLVLTLPWHKFYWKIKIEWNNVLVPFMVKLILIFYLIRVLFLLLYYDRPWRWPVIWSSTCMTQEWGKKQVNLIKSNAQREHYMLLKTHVLSFSLKMPWHQWKWTINSLLTKIS